MTKKFLQQEKLEYELKNKLYLDRDRYNNNDTLKNSCPNSVKFRENFNGFLDTYAEIYGMDLRLKHLDTKISEVNEDQKKQDVPVELLKERNFTTNNLKTAKRQNERYMYELKNTLNNYCRELDEKMSNLAKSLNKSKNIKYFKYFEPDFVSNLLTDVRCLYGFIDDGKDAGCKIFKENDLKNFNPKFLSEEERKKNEENDEHAQTGSKLIEKDLMQFYNKSLTILKVLGYSYEDIFPETNKDYSDDYERVKQLFIDAVRRGSLRQVSQVDISILIRAVGNDENELSKIAKCIGADKIKSILKFNKKKDRILGCYSLTSGELINFLKNMLRSLGCAMQNENEPNADRLVKEQNNIDPDDILRVKADDVAITNYDKCGDDIVGDIEYYDVCKDYDAKLNKCIADNIDLLKQEENEDLLDNFFNKNGDNEDFTLKCFKGNEANNQYIDFAELYRFLLNEKNINATAVIDAIKQLNVHLNTDEIEMTKRQNSFWQKYQNNPSLMAQCKLSGLLIMCFANPYNGNYTLTPQEKNFIIKISQELATADAQHDRVAAIMNGHSDEIFFDQDKRKKLLKDVKGGKMLQFCFKKKNDPINGYNDNKLKTNLAAIDYIWNRVFKHPEVANQIYNTNAVAKNILKLSKEERKYIESFKEFKKYHHEYNGEYYSDYNDSIDYSDSEDFDNEEANSQDSSIESIDYSDSEDFDNEEANSIDYSDSEDFDNEEANSQDSSIEKSDSDNDSDHEYSYDDETNNEENDEQIEEDEQSVDNGQQKLSRKNKKILEKLLGIYDEIIKIMQENDRRSALIDMAHLEIKFYLMIKNGKSNDELREMQNKIKKAEKEYLKSYDEELLKKERDELINEFSSKKKHDYKNKISCLETCLSTQNERQSEIKKKLKEVIGNLEEVCGSFAKKKHNKNKEKKYKKDKGKMYRKLHKTVYSSEPDLSYSSDSEIGMLND